MDEVCNSFMEGSGSGFAGASGPNYTPPNYVHSIGGWQGFNFIPEQLIETKKRTITFVIDSKDTTSTIMTRINSAFSASIQDLHIQEGTFRNGY